MSYDLSLTEGQNGRLVAHKPDCMVVTTHRNLGLPIMTMLGIDGPLPDDVAKCECLRRENLKEREE